MIKGFLNLNPDFGKCSPSIQTLGGIKIYRLVNLTFAQYDFYAKFLKYFKEFCLTYIEITSKILKTSVIQTHGKRFFRNKNLLNANFSCILMNKAALNICKIITQHVQERFLQANELRLCSKNERQCDHKNPYENNE